MQTWQDIIIRAVAGNAVPDDNVVSVAGTVAHLDSYGAIGRAMIVLHPIVAAANKNGRRACDMCAIPNAGVADDLAVGGDSNTLHCVAIHVAAGHRAAIYSNAIPIIVGRATGNSAGSDKNASPIVLTVAIAHRAGRNTNAGVSAVLTVAIAHHSGAHHDASNAVGNIQAFKNLVGRRWAIHAEPILPAAYCAVPHGNIDLCARNINSILTSRHAQQGKAIEVECDIVRGYFNPVLATDAHEVRCQIIGAGLADDEQIARIARRVRGVDDGARLDLVERLHHRRGRARRRETALGEGG